MKKSYKLSLAIGGTVLLTGLTACSSSMKLTHLFPFLDSGESRLETTENKTDKFWSSVRPTRNTAEALFRTASFYQERNRHGLAIQEFKRVVSMDPTHMQAYNGMGISCDRLGDYAGAIEAYQQALRLNPEADFVYNNMGYSCLLQGKIDQAIDAFKKAIALNPDNGRYHNNLGLAYSKKGQLELAFEEFKLAGGELEARQNIARLSGRNEEDPGVISGPQAPSDSSDNVHTLAENVDKTATPAETEGNTAGGYATFTFLSELEKEPSFKKSYDITAVFSDLIISDGDKKIAQTEFWAGSVANDVAGATENATAEAEAAKVDQAENTGRIALDENNGIEEPSARGQNPLATHDNPTMNVSMASSAAAAHGEEGAARPASSPDNNAWASFAVNDREIPGLLPGGFSDISFPARPASIAGNRPAEAASYPRSLPGAAGIGAVGAIAPPTNSTPARDGIGIEVSNGNGVPRIAEAMGDYLTQKGVKIARVSDAKNFEYSETIIYYCDGYLQDAYQVAKQIPMYQNMKRVPRLLNEDIKIKVVVGKDMVRRNALRLDRDVLKTNIGG